MPVKEDLAAIMSLKEAVACLVEEPGHAGMRKFVVSLDEPTAAIDELLDLRLAYPRRPLGSRGIARHQRCSRRFRV